MNAALSAWLPLVKRKTFHSRTAVAIWCGILIGVTPPAIAADKALLMKKVTVNARPFADLGIDFWGNTNLLNSFGGMLPLENVIVYQVNEGSPAEKAGIQTGDEIVAVENRPLKEIPVRELREMLVLSTGGKTVRITVYDWVKREHRSLTVKMLPPQSWKVVDDKWERWNCWGVVVKIWDPRPSSFGQVDSRQRSMTLHQARKKITLRQRSDESVELFEGEPPKNSAPKKVSPAIASAPVRVLTPGSLLRINADGTYAIEKIALNARPKE